MLCFSFFPITHTQLIAIVEDDARLDLHRRRTQKYENNIYLVHVFRCTRLDVYSTVYGYDEFRLRVCKNGMCIIEDCTIFHRAD